MAAPEEREKGTERARRFLKEFAALPLATVSWYSTIHLYVQYMVDHPSTEAGKEVGEVAAPNQWPPRAVRWLDGARLWLLTGS